MAVKSTYSLHLFLTKLITLQLSRLNAFSNIKPLFVSYEKGFFFLEGSPQLSINPTPENETKNLDEEQRNLPHLTLW